MDDSVGVVASVPIVSSSIHWRSALLWLISWMATEMSVTHFLVTHQWIRRFSRKREFCCCAKLPVIFVCENNLYSVYTHLSERQPNRDLARIGEAHGRKRSD